MDIWSIVLTAVFGLIATIFGFILQQKYQEVKKLKSEEAKKVSDRRQALENGMVCILRKHLMDEHETWVKNGSITSKALESDLLMYRAYKDLGGNGMIDHMEDEIQELPIID